jgi:phosphoglycerol transferase MdoB-like AlkP superfamily enzyme
MPTLLNLLDISPEIPMFGEDLYSRKDPYFAAVSYFDDGIIITKDKVYADGKIQGIENGACYTIQGEAWVPTKNSSCGDLVLRRDKEADISTKLIKYNLFREIE